MEGNTSIFNDAAVLMSAGAAAVSAFFAGLAFLFSRRLSTREKIDILKAEILRFVSIVENRQAWVTMGILSRQIEGWGIGPDVRSLADFLGAKYKKEKWVVLIPAAIEELRHEGYSQLLGL